MVALLLLTAANAEREEMVDDYMETVRLGEVRAAASRGTMRSPAMQATASAGNEHERSCPRGLEALHLEEVLARGEMSPGARKALMTWRGSISAAD